MKFKDKLNYVMQTAWSRDFTFQEFIWLTEDAKLEHTTTELQYAEFCKTQEDQMGAFFEGFTESEIQKIGESLFK